MHVSTTCHATLLHPHGSLKQASPRDALVRWHHAANTALQVTMQHAKLVQSRKAPPPTRYKGPRGNASTLQVKEGHLGAIKEMDSCDLGRRRKEQKRERGRKLWTKKKERGWQFRVTNGRRVWMFREEKNCELALFFFLFAWKEEMLKIPVKGIGVREYL